MKRLPSLPVALGLAAVLAACSTDLPTFAPEAPLGVPGQAAFSVAEEVTLNLCKSWVDEENPAPAQTWTFRITGSDGSDHTVTRDFYGCAPLTGLSWAPDVTLTFEEIVPEGFELRITAAVQREGSSAPFLFFESPAVNPLVIKAGDYQDVFFKNAKGDIPPPPPGMGEGCTPGFWRQPQHYAFWADPYVPGVTTWAEVFDAPTANGGSNAPARGNAGGRATSGALTGDMLLSDAVQLTGGGVNALARHAVAAILNAASADVDYDLTVAEIVELVNAALASGDFEGAKDVLEGFNEQGCSVKD